MRTGFIVLLLSVTVASFADVTPSQRPGVLGAGLTLLPNGWKIAPAGRHVPVGSLPLAIIQSADGRSLFIASNGFERPAVVVVDPDQLYVRGSVILDHAWLGMAWNPDGSRLYVSGAANGTVHELRWSEGRLTPGVDLVLSRAFNDANRADDGDLGARGTFLGGLAVSPDGKRVFVVDVGGQMLTAVDLATGRAVQTVDLAAEPYTAVVSPDGATVFVSLWGGSKVLAFDAKTLAPRGEIATNEHPNAMAMTKDGRRLFVATASTNTVAVIDVTSSRVVEQIGIGMFPNAPPGSTPNHVSLSPGDQQLLVTNADNNVVAVVDVSKAGSSEVLGFIPTGWYPTAAIFSNDGKQIFVLSGKGLTSAPNPRLVAGRA